MKKILKISLYTFLVILGIIVGVVVFLITPAGQAFVTQQATNYLSEKLKTPFSVGKIKYNIPSSIGIEDLLLIDQNQDTLAYLHYLDLKVNMWSLINSHVNVKSLDIDGASIYLHRKAPDSFYNYQYIIDAFAGSPDTSSVLQKETATQGNSLKIEVVKTNLKNTTFRFNDESGGTDFFIHVQDLLLKPKDINLDLLQFNIEELNINGVKSNMVLGKSILPPSPPDTSASSPFTLSIQTLKLANAEYVMDMQSDAPMQMKVNVGLLDGRLPLFDLLTQRIDASKLHLSDTRAAIVMGKTTTTTPKKDTVVQLASIDTLGWKITAQDVKFKSIQFKMDDENAVPLKDGMDYAHLNVKDLFLISDNLYYTSDTISGSINQLALKEKSGLVIEQFKTNFIYHNKGAQLEDFLLKTPNTTLQNKLIVHYNSLSELSNNIGKMGLDIHLENSKVAVNDLLLFVPNDLKKTLSTYKNQSIALSTTLLGTVDQLSIKQFQLAGLNNTKVQLNGSLSGLPNTEKLRFQLNIAELSSTNKDINPFLPDSVKMLVNLPDRIAASGSVSGSLYEYQPNLKVLTSDGNALVNGSIKLKPEGREYYDLHVQTSNLNLGKILRQDSLLGVVNTTLSVKGNSFDPKQMNSTIKLDAFAAQLLGYNYHSIEGQVHVNNGYATINAWSKDPNLYFNLDGRANLNPTYPEIYASLDMNNVDLQALKLVDDTLKFAGVLHVDIPELNIDYPKATITGNELEISLPGNKLPMDSIYIVAQSDSVLGQNIVMDIAKIVHLNLTGKIPLTQIGTTYLYHIDKYYTIGDTFARAANYDMVVNGSIRYNPILTRYDRNIKPFDTIKLNSFIDQNAFDVNVYVPWFRYGNQVIDSTYVAIKEANAKINYKLGVKRFNSRDQFSLLNTSLGGDIKNDTIYARAVIKDTSFNDRFIFGLAINKAFLEENSLTNIRMFEGLMIDYDIWNVNRANKITLGPNGFKIKDFFIRKDEQSIALNSETDSFNSPVAAKIDNFKLSSFTKILNPDTLLADGILNTDIVADFNPPIPFIKGDASITNLEIFQTPFGNASLHATTKNENTYNAALKIDGNGNDVTLVGDYYINPFNGNNFDFSLNINPLALKSVEGLTFGSLANSSGTVNGVLKINGTFEQPRITGSLLTDNLKTTVSMLNSTFLLPKEKIAFTSRGIEFDQFKIYDYRNKYATLNGRIGTRNYTNFFLNLNFNSTNWSPINSTSKDYEMFYGKLFMSSAINLRGNVKAPNITGDLTIHDSTKLAFALLDSDPQLVETEGIVKFVDHRYPAMEWDADSVDNVLNRVRFSQTAQMNVNLGVEKNAKFNIIIDPSTGDNLLVNGEASLNAQIAPNGSIAIAGTYTLDDGYYELSFPPVRRKFKIQEGSTITLAGDPLDATVNITAIFKANVAPYDLVEKQVSNPADLVYYKQQLPFDVLLKLNGKAMSPNITFDVVLPEGVSSVSSDVVNTVQNKLTSLRTNSSEINKQVFALIVLKRFITDETFSSSGGGVNVESIARQSVSRFLSSQLNSLAGQLVTGLDINMDLESSEDYTTGQKVNRTDLNISASKSLLDDRLSITVGNDFLLEGANNVGGKSSGIPGNISADYKITQDGKYVVRGYRKNELQNLIDGYVVETGLGLRYSLQYNRFKYVFMNKEKLKERYKKFIQEERKIIEEENRKNEQNNPPKELQAPASSSSQLPVLPTTFNNTLVLPQVLRAIYYTSSHK